MNLGATVKMFGGMNSGNWFVDSWGMSNLTTSASFTEYWQGMMSVLIKFPGFDPTENILLPTPI